jgi:hypothetical protein
MISHKNKFIFIHIPKTGGTSVERALLENEGIKWPTKHPGPLDALPDEICREYMLRFNSMQHYPLGKFEATLQKKYYAFTFVRNPWDNVASEYHYSSTLGLNKCSFEKYVEYLDRVHRYEFHLKPQIEFINENINFVGRFENLQEDFDKACTAIGVPSRKLSCENTSIHKPYWEYYNEDTKRIVEEKYKKDIEYFGYNFGDEMERPIKIKNRKVFFFGYQKTATTTIDNLFLLNDFKTRHHGWTLTEMFYLNEFQVFSDTGNRLNIKDTYDYEKYLELYPDGVIVLNTRGLDGWLRSRAKHSYWRGKYDICNFGYPISEEIVMDWIVYRNQYYVDLLLFFLQNPSKLIVLDVDKDGWINFLCDLFELKFFDLYLNKTHLSGDIYIKQKNLKDETEEIPLSYLGEIDGCIKNAYSELEIDDFNSSLLVKSVTDDTIYKKIYSSLDQFCKN